MKFQKGHKPMGRAINGHLVSKATRRKISKAHKGKIPWNKGKKRPSFSDEWKRKIGLAAKGNKSHFWKGGITHYQKAIRKSFEYKLWRKAVFTRDNFTCQKHNIKGGILHSHHINNFAEFPELRFAIDNGRTLCIDCHKTTDTYCNKTRPK